MKSEHEQELDLHILHLEIMKKKLGSDHLDVATCNNKLAQPSSIESRDASVPEGD